MLSYMAFQVQKWDIYREHRILQTSLELPALASSHTQVAVQDPGLAISQYLEELGVAYHLTKSLRMESETVRTVKNKHMVLYMVTDVLERLQQPYGTTFQST